MRIFTTIIFIGFVFTGTAMAADQKNETKPAASEETKVALTYLNRLSNDKLDLAEHTALSKHCGIERRKRLRTRIDFLRKNYFLENDSLTIEAQKIESTLGGILIRAENPAAPLSVRIHAVALIKKENVWMPAPLPGLFSNTGYGYDEAMEQSVRSLERWMAKEKILRESQHREKATSKLTSSLTTIEREAGFDKMNPEQAAAYFLEQCRNNNLFGILTSMGGASNALTEPMEMTINMVSNGLTDKKPDSAWNLVTNRTVLSQILEFNKKTNEVAVGFYNPMETSKHKASKVLYFPIHSSGGKTFIRLSPLLKLAIIPEQERWKQRQKHRRTIDAEQRKKLLSAIFENSKAISYPTPQKLLDHFLTSLKKGDFTDCISLVPRKGDYFEKKENQPTLLANLGSFWRNIQALRSVPFHPFDIIAEENLALAPLQYTKTHRTSELQTIKIWMLKDDDGWHLISPDSLTESIGEELKATVNKIEKRFLTLEKKHQDEYARTLLDKVAIITPPLSLDVVPDEDAKKLFANYRNHLRNKNTQDALSRCAVLKGTSNAQTLKTLHYALRGASDHKDYDHILGVTKKGKWTGLSVRTQSKNADLTDYPLYVMANTTKGSRILIDIDLRYSSNKGRELLNNKNWRKLEQNLPKDALDDLKGVFEKHVELATKDINELVKIPN